jgi:hypothetical protein
VAVIVWLLARSDGVHDRDSWVLRCHPATLLPCFSLEQTQNFVLVGAFFVETSQRLGAFFDWEMQLCELGV